MGCTSVLDGASRLPNPIHGRHGAGQEHVRAADVDADGRSGSRTRWPARRYRRRRVPERLRLLPLHGQASGLQAAARPVHRFGAGPTARAQPRDGQERRRRRLGPPGLRQRPAVPFQERPGAREVFRSRRLVGPSLGRLYAQGRRGLRLQGPRGRLHRNRPAARMDDRDGERSRDDVRARPDRRREGARVRPDDRDHGQGL